MATVNSQFAHGIGELFAKQQATDLIFIDQFSVCVSLLGCLEFIMLTETIAHRLFPLINYARLSSRYLLIYVLLLSLTW